MTHNYSKNNNMYTIYNNFSKERYNTHAKSCNSIFNTKTNSATNIRSILGTMFYL